MSFGDIGGLGETYPEWKRQQREEVLKKSEAERDQMQVAGAPVGRQSGKDALRDLVNRKFGEAERLNRLLVALPGEMSGAADEALWALVKGYR